MNFSSERADLHTDNKSTDAPTVFVHPEPHGRTDHWGSIGFGANHAASLLDPHDDVLDLGPADRLSRSPWPGDSVSAVYPSPPNYIPLASTSER